MTKPSSEATEEQPSAKVEEGQEGQDGVVATVEETVDEDAGATTDGVAKGRVNWARVFAYGVLPAIALLLAMASGYLRWQDTSVRESQNAGRQALQVAKDDTVAILSYKSDTVEQQLTTAARERLTGDFRGYYEGLINSAVIPLAKQKQVSAVANIVAAGPVSAQPNRAVVLLYVDQFVTVGNEPPVKTPSSVRVTLDEVDGRWLISQFQPI
jgi:Mce-associated membrane protein